MTPAHGFCDDPATRRLLRSRPPSEALRWAERQLGGRVQSVRALRGGMSSAVHLLTVVARDGARQHTVLRRYVRPELNVEEPDLAEREARALRYLEVVDVPSPALLALDPSGSEAGVPALLMSRVPGRVDWWPRHMEPWLQQLAEVLPRIHSAPSPDPGVIEPFSTYKQESYDAPPWARHPRIWGRAVDIFHGPQPAEKAVFIQRDFHPGNVLWTRGRISGVVDWQAASVGLPSIDVAHCRANLLVFGPEAATRFVRLWENVTGQAHHPWADVVTVIGCLDDLRDGWGSERWLVEDLLARAVADLGA